MKMYTIEINYLKFHQHAVTTEEANMREWSKAEGFRTLQRNRKCSLILVMFLSLTQTYLRNKVY